MRYAVVSDLHANLPAWNAVLLDIRTLELDRIVCLGDIVGYGPSPAEVLQSVYANVDSLTLGNHDAVICGKMDPSSFNEKARKIIEWTRQQLSGDAMKFLQTLPLTLKGEGFRCAHGDFGEPAAFNYVIDPEDAMPSWQAVDEQLLFVGHSHQPGIFLLGRSGTPRVVEPTDFAVEKEKRYLVNVGSVGQPRDGQSTACYCILDTDERSVCWRRIPFDLDAFRNELKRKGVSEDPSHFLRHDPRLGKPPLRTILNFTPPTAPENFAQNAVEVQELTTLRRRVARWRVLFAVALLAAVGLGLAAAGAWWYYRNLAAAIADPTGRTVEASAVLPDQNLLTTPDLPVPAGAPIPGWTVSLGHKRKQAVSVDRNAEGGTVFTLRSAARGYELDLSSAPVTVSPDMKLCFEVLFRKSADFAGNISVVVSLARGPPGAEQTVDQYIVKEPNLPRQGEWLAAKNTFTLPADTHRIMLHVRGKFTGEVAVSPPSLVRRPATGKDAPGTG
jgi:predicted phosphodiesterase